MTSWGRRGFDDSESAAAEGGSSGGGGGDQLMSAGFGDTGLKSRCARSLRSWTGRGTNKLGNGGGRQTLAEVEDDERVEASRGRVVRGERRLRKRRAGLESGRTKGSGARSATQRRWMEGRMDGWQPSTCRSGGGLPRCLGQVVACARGRQQRIGGVAGSCVSQKSLSLCLVSRLDPTAACVYRW